MAISERRSPPQNGRGGATLARGFEINACLLALTCREVQPAGRPAHRFPVVPGASTLVGTAPAL